MDEIRHFSLINTEERPSEPMKQLTVITLVWHLVKCLFKYGNVLVYYHLPMKDSFKAPLEVEGLEVREGHDKEPKLTIY